MTSSPRIDRLTEPAVVGRIYLVPTVRAIWPTGVRKKDWPVIGPKHADIEFLDFEWQHYHVDARFVGGPALHRWIMVYRRGYGAYFHTPISSYRQTIGDVRWAPLEMRREWPAYPAAIYSDPKSMALRAHYAGHQCEHGKGGWICPHRKASLGSLTPVDGIITCPLHGLRIEAESGRVTG